MGYGLRILLVKSLWLQTQSSLVSEGKERKKLLQSEEVWSYGSDPAVVTVEVSSALACSAAPLIGLGFTSVS